MAKENPLIMVVEDEEDYANVIARMVTSTDKYDAHIAHSAEKAFELLKKNKRAFGIFPNKIRCILLDIKMPGMDGLQFLEKLRKEYKERIGIVLITAYEDEDKWDKAMSGNVMGYLTKPFKQEELLGIIDRYFQGQEDNLITENIAKSIDREDANYRKEA